MRPSARPKPLKLGGSINKLTRFVYVTVENQREREVSKQAKARERERERERGWERQAVTAPMTICFSRTSSPKSAKSREITKLTGSLSLSLSAILYIFLHQFLFSFLFIFFLIFRLRYWI